MSLGTNVQFLRKRQDMTQEEFAEKLAISRQTVSKWESDTSFPEMEKLLILCDLFGCDLDTLTRGDAAASIADDSVGYDRHMNGFTWTVCIGASLPIWGVCAFLLLTSRGINEVLGIMALLIFVLFSAAIFIVGGIRHGDFVRKHPQILPFYKRAQIDAFDRKFPFLIAVPTVLILLGVIGLLGLEAFPRPEGIDTERFSQLCVAAFMAIIGISTPMYIYGGMQKAKYNITEYNEENAPTLENARKSRLKGTICSIIMLLSTVVYLIMGLGFDLWQSAAIPFAVGGLLCAVASAIVNGLVRKA